MGGDDLGERMGQNSANELSVNATMRIDWESYDQ